MESFFANCWASTIKCGSSSLFESLLGESQNHNETPITSYPLFLSNIAVTDESVPPLIPNTTLFLSLQLIAISPKLLIRLQN